MTQVRLLSTYAGAAGTVGNPGDLINVSESEAAALIAGGYAEAYTHSTAAKDTLSDGDVFNIDRGGIMRIKPGGILDVSGAIIVSTGGVCQLSDETQPMISGHVRAKLFEGQNRTTAPTPTVTIMFDDGYDDIIDYLYPVAAAKGVKFVMAIIGSKPGSSSSYMTWDEIKTLYDLGHEVVNHSHTHPISDGSRLTQIGEAAAVAEIALADAALREHGINPESFCPPGHYTDEDLEALIQRYYRASRSKTVTPYYNDKVLPLMRLNSTLDLNDVADGTDVADAKLDALKALVTSMQTLYTANSSDGRWLIMYGHAVTEAGAAKVGELIDHIQATADVEILTMSEALDKHGPAFYSGSIPDARGFGVGPDGSLRAREGHFVDKTQVWDAANPYSNYVTISYVSGNLELQAYSTSHDVVIASSGSLRPKVNGTIGCGEHAYAWLDCYSYAYETRNQEGDRLTRKSYRLGGIQMTSSPKTVDANLPAGAKPIMMVAAVSTELQGCANWQIGFSGGSDVVWGTALANAAGTVIRVMYDPVNDGSNRAVFDAETDIVVTAAGVTAGAIRVAVFYEEPGAHS